MYSAVNLAKYIINKCVKDEVPISNIQLQMILYCIQKEFLKRDTLAFGNSIEAWQFGPVIPNVYYEFCGFGSMPISVCFCNAAELSSADSNEIDSIIEGKRLLEPWELKNDICCSKSAWAKVFNNGTGNRTEIQIDAVKEEISKEGHKNKQ